MHENEKNDLQCLDDFDRRLVISYWRWLLWRRIFLRLPVPLQYGAVTFFVTSTLEEFFPTTKYSPLMEIITLWIAAFFISVTICMLLPLCSRSRAHI